MNGGKPTILSSNPIFGKATNKINSYLKFT